MTGNQSDRLDMYDVVLTYIQNTNVIAATRAGLITGKTNLAAVVAEIKQKVAAQGTQTGGSSDEKEVMKGELALVMFSVTSGTYGYASSIENLILKEEMNYSLSELQKLRDDTIETVCNNIKSKVEAHLGVPLEGFGVDAEVLEIMEAAKSAYVESKDKPREAAVDKKVQTDALGPLFTKATGILHDIMDKAANTLNATEKDWFSGYHNARMIITTGRRHTTAEGYCLEHESNTPIYNATVTLKSIGKDDIVLKTDLNGHWKQIPIKNGVWAFLVTHPDYVDFSVSAYEIKLGQTVVKTSIMDRKPPLA